MFEKRFRSTIREFSMIKKGEKIALGLSGGKDSTTMLHALAALRKDLPFELIAITIDIGTGCDYNDKILQNAKKEAKKLGVPHHVYTFKKEIGHTLPQAIEKAKLDAPCSFCGVVRRAILNRKARELGADKLAIAHTLDDSAQTVVMNIIRNEPVRLLRYNEPLVQSDGFVPRIKPFLRCPEAEVVAYGKLMGVPVEEKKCCPFSKSAMRAVIRNQLDELEEIYPGTKFRVLNSFLALQKMARLAVEEQKPEVGTCKGCGEPSSQDKCMNCRMLEKLKK